MNTIYAYRNAVLHALYVRVLKPFLWLFDPENVHDFFLACGAFFGKFAVTRWKIGLIFGYKNKVLTQKVAGISFENPIGLSAGFDKDGVLPDIISSVGFGFEEIGSVTAHPYTGNPRPRLWRLPNSKSLGVWYGLKNDGADRLVRKLESKSHRLPLGVSVAMTNCAENLDIDTAIKDYVTGFRTVLPVADYITVNISCPNTLGGQPFVIPENYDKLMSEIDTVPTDKPIFIKLSPDMDRDTVDAFLNISKKHRVTGFICTNLTKKFSADEIKDAIPPHGGLSGKVVYPKAMELLKYMYKSAGDTFVFIYCGGIFSAEDAYATIRNGASLIQMITGMIFEGPQIVSEINRGLVEHLKTDGFRTISEAVGVDNPVRQDVTMLV